MRKMKVAQTDNSRSKKKRNYGLILVDLHSSLSLIASASHMMHTKVSKTLLANSFHVRQARENIHILRESFSSDCLLRDISAYYRNFAIQHQGGYWIHGNIKVHAFLDAIEQSISLALTGNVDFTRPLRALNKRYPYHRRAAA
jgi:hypothetical protein